MTVQAKRCSHCGVIKSIENFSKDSSRLSGTRNVCKKCSSILYKEYYKKNSDKQKDKSKRFREVKPEKVKEMMDIWRKNNIEEEIEYRKKYYLDNTEKVKQLKQKWRDDNPEKFRLLNMKYSSITRALKKATIIEDVRVLQVFETCNWICGICKKKINKNLRWPNIKSMSLDHIIPLSKGGTHTYNNLQSTHLGCNIRKGNKINNLQLKI